MVTEEALVFVVLFDEVEVHMAGGEAAMTLSLSLDVLGWLALECPCHFSCDVLCDLKWRFTAESIGRDLLVAK